MGSESIPLAPLSRAFSFRRALSVRLSKAFHPAELDLSLSPPGTSDPTKTRTSVPLSRVGDEQDRPLSRGSMVSSIPGPGPSRHGSGSNPSDYELFLAKTRAEYDEAQERNWPVVTVDEDQFVRGKGREDIRRRRRRLAHLRTALRTLQVFVRFRSEGRY
jgi:hypothetical protein